MIEIPLDRLAAIHDGMKMAKGQQNAIGADTLQNWVEFAAPAVLGLAVRTYSRTKMADRHRPLFNVTISNVPGPPFPLYVAGAQMKATYPIGPIFDGGGLNITVIVAVVAAFAVSAAFGWVNDAALWHPLRRRGTGVIAMMIVSIGLSILLFIVLWWTWKMGWIEPHGVGG